MNISHHSTINRLAKEIADLQKKDAVESKKEASLIGKLNRAETAASKTKSLSTLQSKMREVERASRDLASVRKKRSEISAKLADRSKKLGDSQQKQLKSDQAAQAKLAAEQSRLMREQTVLQSSAISTVHQARPAASVTYDFFISHASEDKLTFVRALVEALEHRGAGVWYDELTLRVGHSLRENIDLGLANSRFGIVVLSEHFFGKSWPTKELNGLLALEIEGRSRILPIWHKVSKDEVASFSPILADKVALNTALLSVEEIAEKLGELLVEEC